MLENLFRPPPEPPLPLDRLTGYQAFEISGVDYSGAIMIKDDGVIKKAYIALFTCTVTRALYLEPVYSLSEEDFLRTFIKFSSRCSLPKILYSDNATNFCSAAKTLQQISESALVSNYMLENLVEWKFITPRAPWVGGFYERLVGLTKTSFKKIIGKEIVKRADFETILPQIEAALNNRPLTYISDDVRDLDPITPSKLVRGYNLRLFPISIDSEYIDDPSFGTRDHLTKCLIHRCNLVKRIWSRWQHEYLVTLRERYCANTRGNYSAKVGNVVLIHDDCPRVFWKMGKIVELLNSNDGYARSAKVKTANNILIRPISKLYPLEINCEPDSRIAEIADIIVRPRRKAAVDAADRISRMT